MSFCSDFVDDVTESPSWTALQMAVDRNLPDIVRVLLKYGAGICNTMIVVN